MPDAFDNPFLDFLETSREGQLGAFLNVGGPYGRSPRKRRDLTDLFDEARNEFLAELSGQVLGGGAPTLTWTEYLTRGPQQGGFDIASRLARTSGLRAQGESIYNPRTRFIFG